jgi:DNA-binding MarR family transcriptional regulator
MERMRKVQPMRTIRTPDYRALAEFRYHIRRYLEFSDESAKRAGLEPKQYQLLLAIRGLPLSDEPTVGTLAKQLRIRPNSTVELINRAEANKFVSRHRVGGRVFVRLTSQGEKVLESMVAERLEDLHVAGPGLVSALRRLMRTKANKKRRP